MGTRPPRRASAAIWAVSLAGAGLLALAPVARAGAAAAPNPPQRNGHVQQQPPRSGGNDPHSWHNWQSNWRDQNFRSSHSADSRHERFDDRGRGRFVDRFHLDDFRGHFGDADFRADCDGLHGVSTVRALLDFLDAHPALRDYFEDHGDLFDYLVNHTDLGDGFDADCTLVDVF